VSTPDPAAEQLPADLARAFPAAAVVPDRQPRAYGPRDDVSAWHWRSAHVDPSRAREWAAETGRKGVPARGALPDDLVAEYLAERGPSDIPLPGVPPAAYVAAGRPALVDASDMTLKGPCPACGKPTPCGWRERDYRTGRWSEVRADPTPCGPCRLAAALDPAAPEPPAEPPGGAESWTVLGHAVTLTAGVLALDGRQVAHDVAPADITLYARRLYVGGRSVADLAAAALTGAR
jgi:hypothetical protein